MVLHSFIKHDLSELMNHAWLVTCQQSRISDRGMMLLANRGLLQLLFRMISVLTSPSCAHTLCRLLGQGISAEGKGQQKSRFAFPHCLESQTMAGANHGSV